MRRTYETVVILSNKIDDSKKEEILNKALSYITNNGEIIYNENWGVRTLSYKINKEETGDYRYLAYVASPESVKKMEFYFRITEPVLRYLTVKLADIEKKDIEKPNPENLE